MEAGVILLILGLGLLGGSALLAFSWAARDGQFDDLEKAARVIFDAGELEAFDAGEDLNAGKGKGDGGDFWNEDEEIGKSGRDEEEGGAS